MEYVYGLVFLIPIAMVAAGCTAAYLLVKLRDNA